MNRKSDRKIGLIFRELVSGVGSLLLSEAHLFQVELKHTAQVTRRRAFFAAVAFSIAVVGCLPFVAFLVLALGQVMGDRYVLSSLIVSLTCWILGGSLAFHFAKEIPTGGFSLPRTRESIQREAQIFFQGENQNSVEKSDHSKFAKEEKAS